jgi:hypothetical protein
MALPRASGTNISAADLARLKKLAALYLDASLEDLESWCERSELKEVA